MCWWALADGTGGVLVVAGGWALLALLALGTTRNAWVAPCPPCSDHSGVCCVRGAAYLMRYITLRDINTYVGSAFFAAACAMPAAYGAAPRSGRVLRSLGLFGWPANSTSSSRSSRRSTVSYVPHEVPRPLSPSSVSAQHHPEIVDQLVAGHQTGRMGHSRGASGGELAAQHGSHAVQ